MVEKRPGIGGAFFGCLILIGGCAQTQMQVTPMVPASPADVSAVKATLPIMSPDEYAAIGYAINDQRCWRNFEDRARNFNAAVLGAQQVGLAGTGGAMAATLAGAAAPVVGGIATGVGILVQGIHNQANASLGSATPPSAWYLDQKGMTAFRQTTAQHPPQTLPDAMDYVERHGELCTQVGTELLLDQAAMTAQPAPTLAPEFSVEAPPVDLAPPLATYRSQRHRPSAAPQAAPTAKSMDEVYQRLNEQMRAPRGPAVPPVIGIRPTR